MNEHYAGSVQNIGSYGFTFGDGDNDGTRTGFHKISVCFASIHSITATCPVRKNTEGKIKLHISIDIGQLKIFD